MVKGEVVGAIGELLPKRSEKWMRTSQVEHARGISRWVSAQSWGGTSAWTLPLLDACECGIQLPLEVERMSIQRESVQFVLCMLRM